MTAKLPSPSPQGTRNTETRPLQTKPKSPVISCAYHNVWPPVSARLWPVMNALASDAMNTMAACTYIKHCFQSPLLSEAAVVAARAAFLQRATLPRLAKQDTCAGQYGMGVFGCIDPDKCGM